MDGPTDPTHRFGPCQAKEGGRGIQAIYCRDEQRLGWFVRALAPEASGTLRYRRAHPVRRPVTAATSLGALLEFAQRLP